MRKTHDLVATTGTYKDREGNEKKRYTNVGAMFEDDQGRISIKLETIPVGPNWSGWLACYEPRADQQPRTASVQDRMPPGRQQQRTMPPAPQGTVDDGPEDDIPF